MNNPALGKLVHKEIKEEEIIEEVNISKEDFNKTLKQYESDVLFNRFFQISFDMKNKDKIKLIDLINNKKTIIANKSTYVIQIFGLYPIPIFQSQFKSLFSILKSLIPYLIYI